MRAWTMFGFGIAHAARRAAALGLGGLAFAATVSAAELTEAEKAARILEPELQDAFHGQVDRMYLNGWWKFKPVVNFIEKKGDEVKFKEGCPTANPKSDEGLEKGFFHTEFDTKDWSELPVPWVWNLVPDFKAGGNACDRKMPFAGLGYYRHQFIIPEEKKGKRTILHFTSVQSECHVWLNGMEIGMHVNSSQDGGVPWCFNNHLLLDDFEFDITKAANFGGDNVLVLRVFDDGQPIVSNQANDGGIAGPVTLDFADEIRATEILVAADPKTGEVKCEATLLNAGEKDSEIQLQAEIVPFESRFYNPSTNAKAATAGLDKMKVPVGESRHAFSFKVPNPVAWDTETPALYRMRLVSGKNMIGQTRFGFRTFEVKGGRFLLNGHPVYIRGAGLRYSWQNLGFLPPAFNKGNCLRESLKLYKVANFNLLRVYNGPATRAYYDICDELGILNQDDYSPDSKALRTKEITHTEKIATTVLDKIVGSDGKLSPTAAAAMRKWVGRLHNHPSVCMLTAGNELGGERNGTSDKAMTIYMNSFYDLVKAADLQKRPITPSSGLVVWEWGNDNAPKADYYDFHWYACGFAGNVNIAGAMQIPHSHLSRIFGRIDKPAINGESGYFLLCPLDQEVKSLMTNGDIDRVKYAKWTNQIAGKKGDLRLSLGTQLANLAGIRSVSDSRTTSQTKAKLSYDYTVSLRRDCGWMEGVAMFDPDPYYWGMQPVDPALTSAKTAEQSALCRSNCGFLAYRDALAPQAAFLDLCDRHGFAGGTLKSEVFLFNDKYASPEPELTVDVSLEDGNGTVKSATPVVFKDVPERGHLSREFALELPKTLATGDYKLRTRLTKDGKTIHETAAPFFVLAASERQKPPLTTKRKVAVFDRPGAKTGAAHVLEFFGVPYVKLNSFDKLNDFDLLVLGPDSVDAGMFSDAEKLRKWMEDGGRIVCLEQSYGGAIAFASELKFQASGSILFADMIDKSHPLLGSMKPYQFEIWNGERTVKNGAPNFDGKAVFSNYVLPVPEGVVLAGGQLGIQIYTNHTFGMVAGEVKTGKGMVFFSQALATARFESDPVAALYLRNLFEYVLSEKWDGSRASVLTGTKALMVVRENCFFVSLGKSANMAFLDEKDGDQVGGWSDQGANDLRMIQKCDVIFNGVPYWIIDDNGGKSPACLVLRGKVRPYFPKEIKGIEVGKQAGRLYFLHTFTWGKDGEKVGEYCVNYADGKTALIELVAGKNIGGWWEPKDLPEARIACVFPQGIGGTVGMYNFAWDNPHPEKTIKSIDFVSAEGDAVPICAAITGEK